MQKENGEKTKWAHKFGRPVIIVVAGLLLAAIVWASPQSSARLHSGNRVYRLKVVTSAAQMEKGLGDRPTMPANQGMLFEFSNDAVRCFWMKDMHFSLDIIWVNSQKQVMHIESDVSPKTFPNTFCPGTPAHYVIELNAGQAKAAGIARGQSLKF